MKRITCLLLAIILSVMTMGCHAAYSGTDTAGKDNKIEQDFVQIKDNLYYAKNTKVVYWIGGSYTVNTIGEDYTTSYMTPWYAPNGLPYIYDLETAQMVEIGDK